MTGTPTSIIFARAAALLPITRICSGVGPMNAMPLAAGLGELERSRRGIRSPDDGVGAGDLGGGDAGGEILR